MDSALIRQGNFALLVTSLFIMQACAHPRTIPFTADGKSEEKSETKSDEKNDGQSAQTAASPIPPTDAEVARQQITKLQDRVQDLETRLNALNDKINLASGIEGLANTPSLKLPTEAVEAPAAHGKIIPAKKGDRKGKPATVEISLKGDQAIDRFREAKILYDSKRYSDSVLEFAEFVKNESEHPLAAAAQYYVGMSYYGQKEYKLAEEELSRGLISYSHSAYVPDTLLALSQVSEDLKKPTKVAYYREKLLQHFPNSPQAKNLTAGKSTHERIETQVTEPTHPMQTAAEEPSVVTRPETPTVSVPSIESEGP